MELVICKMNLRKILGLKERKEDEVLKFLKEVHDAYLSRAKRAGFESITEYEEFNQDFYFKYLNRNRNYPVSSDC